MRLWVCTQVSLRERKNMFMLVKHLLLVSSHPPAECQCSLGPPCSYHTEQNKLGDSLSTFHYFEENLELENSRTDVTFLVKLAPAVLWLKVLHMFHNLLVTAVLS